MAELLSVAIGIGQPLTIVAARCSPQLRPLREGYRTLAGNTSPDAKGRGQFLAMRIVAGQPPWYAGSAESAGDEFVPKKLILSPLPSWLAQRTPSCRSGKRIRLACPLPGCQDAAVRLPARPARREFRLRNACNPTQRRAGQCS